MKKQAFVEFSAAPEPAFAWCRAILQKFRGRGATRRTPEQIREHYDVERELANRLRNASKGERRKLYTALYDELFRRVPHHTQLTQKSSPRQAARAVARQMRFLRRFLGKNTTFLEIGPGDCALTVLVAAQCRLAYAVDVSEEITGNQSLPGNVRLLLSDGTSVPVPENGVDIAYSNQVMEHLHPDDALEQLRNIFRALAPGGTYVCVTPSRTFGPHDISRYFDSVATGFHLREYSLEELDALFRAVGFLKIRVFIGAKGWFIGLPTLPVQLCERIVARLPARLRRSRAVKVPLKALFGIRLAGVKPALAASSN
jgi:SAM-dependent methyltransferase